MNELCVMDQTGDTKTIWDPANTEEVAAARSTFDRLRGKGYIAYRVAESGKKGEVMSAFDPQAGKVIMAPPMAGG